MSSWSLRVSEGFLAFVFSFLICFSHSVFPFTSEWDEHTHLSYVQYVYEGKVPSPGNEMNTWAKSAFSCHPHAIYGQMTDVPCGSIGAGYGYPTGGSNTSEIWPPIYFGFVAFLMPGTLQINSDPLFAARLGSVLIWSLGMLLLFYFMRIKDTGFTQAFLVTVIISSFPATFYFSAFVSPYAMLPMILGFWLLLLFNGKLNIYEKDQRLSKTAVKSALSLLLIPATVLAVPHAIVAVFALLVAWCASSHFQAFNVDRNETVFRYVYSVVAVALSFTTWVAWSTIQEIRRVAYPETVSAVMANSDPPEIVHHSALDAFFANGSRFIPRALYFENVFDNARFMVTLAVVIVVAVLCASYIKSFKTDIFIIIAFSSVVSAILFSFVFQYILDTPTPARYGFSSVLLILLFLGSPKLKDKKMFFCTISLLASASFLIALLVKPMPIYAGHCELNQDNLIECQN